MKIYVLTLLMLPFFSVYGCGTSLTKAIVSDEEKQTHDNLLAQARAAYDNEDHQDALDFAADAAEINPESIDAAIMTGYAALGNALLDPISLIKKIVDIERAKEDDSTKSTAAENFLSSMNEVLAIGDSTLNKMGTKETVQSALLIHPYYRPNAVSEIRSQFDRLKGINDMIKTICPFVPKDSKQPAVDTRHNCTQKDSGKHASLANFLWALAHIGESVYFNSLFLYVPPGQTKPSLQLYSEAISATTVTSTNAADVVTAVSELGQIASNVFGLGSSLDLPQALLNNISTAELAIANIESAPDSLKNSLSSTSKQISDISTALGTAGSSEGLAKGLQAELTKKYASTLVKKLESSDTSLNAAQKKQACDGVKSLLGIESGPIPNDIVSSDYCD